MGVGTPDWLRTVSQKGIVEVFGKRWLGSGYYTTSGYGGVLWQSWIVEAELGGVAVEFLNFAHHGYVVFTRAVSNVHTIGKGYFITLEIKDPELITIAEIYETHIPVLQDNVHQIAIILGIPTDRIADTTNPCYYTYFVGCSLSYRII